MVTKMNKLTGGKKKTKTMFNTTVMEILLTLLKNGLSSSLLV